MFIDYGRALVPRPKLPASFGTTPLDIISNVLDEPLIAVDEDRCL
jgi:hypothetical protein